MALLCPQGRHAPTKFFQEKGLSASFQDWGHARSTVLCFMPPRPADWIRCDMPSLRLDDTTSWQKPLVFSVPIRDRMFWGVEGGSGLQPHGTVCQPHPPPKGQGGGPGPNPAAIRCPASVHGQRRSAGSPWGPNSGPGRYLSAGVG